MAKRNLLYKSPKIIRCKPTGKHPLGDWYIEYYYMIPDKPGEFKPFKVRAGINYIKDLNDKEKEAKQVRNDVENWLRQGNSPFGVEHNLIEQIDHIEEVEKANALKKLKSNWTMEKAIAAFNNFLSGHGYAERTIETYKVYVDDLRDWLVENEWLDKIASDITEYEIKVFLDDMWANRDWSGRTYNNYFEFYGNFFNRCRKLEKMVHRGIQYKFNIGNVDLKLTTPQVNKPFTPSLFNRIKTELKLRGFENLRDYCEWIFLSFMRPQEIRNLKIQDIDGVTRQIRIIGKSGDRLIPISDQLLRLLNKRDVLKLSPRTYVFGMAGNPSTDRMSVQYFLDQFVTIREKLELDDKYKIYSFKPTGIIAMIHAGFSDQEIMAQTGHKTQKAFEAYKRDLIIDKSHVMKGSTIEF